MVDANPDEGGDTSPSSIEKRVHNNNETAIGLMATTKELTTPREGESDNAIATNLTPSTTDEQYARLCTLEAENFSPNTVGRLHYFKAPAPSEIIAGLDSPAVDRKNSTNDDESNDQLVNNEEEGKESGDFPTITIAQPEPLPSPPEEVHLKEVREREVQVEQIINAHMREESGEHRLREQELQKWRLGRKNDEKKLKGETYGEDSEDNTSNPPSFIVGNQDSSASASLSGSAVEHGDAELIFSEDSEAILVRPYRQSNLSVSAEEEQRQKSRQTQTRPDLNSETPLSVLLGASYRTKEYKEEIERNAKEQRELVPPEQRHIGKTGRKFSASRLSLQIKRKVVQPFIHDERERERERDKEKERESDSSAGTYSPNVELSPESEIRGSAGESVRRPVPPLILSTSKAYTSDADLRYDASQHSATLPTTPASSKKSRRLSAWIKSPKGSPKSDSSPSAHLLISPRNAQSTPDLHNSCLLSTNDDTWNSPVPRTVRISPRGDRAKNSGSDFDELSSSADEEFVSSPKPFSTFRGKRRNSRRMSSGLQAFAKGGTVSSAALSTPGNNSSHNNMYNISEDEETVPAAFLGNESESDKQSKTKRRTKALTMMFKHKKQKARAEDMWQQPSNNGNSNTERDREDETERECKTDRTHHKSHRKAKEMKDKDEEERRKANSANDTLEAQIRLARGNYQ